MAKKIEKEPRVYPCKTKEDFKKNPSGFIEDFSEFTPEEKKAYYERSNRLNSIAENLQYISNTIAVLGIMGLLTLELYTAAKGTEPAKNWYTVFGVNLIFWEALFLIIAVIGLMVIRHFRGKINRF